MSGFLGVPVGAAYHLVSALTYLLTPVAGGLAAAAAIVLFTAAVRLLLSPLSLRALRGCHVIAAGPDYGPAQQRIGHPIVGHILTCKTEQLRVFLFRPRPACSRERDMQTAPVSAPRAPTTV